eukprot:gnl/TRDRNA2_/TRDRNA2_81650_c0_seq1.p1 gnl/TRDRNA2_/TRDRNA2_81650_c0~~gnl/TRDRNA2_/TRDRNA2_81650_c0_seq1.p1  ORF type:complete len:807 (-),score=186.69 gnl/TRDRNA2_/TRDRNA2_81650_c0_seq1:85-2505(-)
MRVVGTCCLTLAARALLLAGTAAATSTSSAAVTVGGYSVAQRSEAIETLLSGPEPQEQLRDILRTERSASSATHGRRSLRRGLSLELAQIPVPPEVKKLAEAAASAAASATPEGVAKGTAILNEMLLHEMWSLDKKVMECRAVKEKLNFEAQASLADVRQLAGEIDFQRGAVAEALAHLPDDDVAFREAQFDARSSRQECKTDAALHKVEEKALEKDVANLNVLQRALRKKCKSSGAAASFLQISGASTRRCCEATGMPGGVALIARQVSSLGTDVRKRLKTALLQVSSNETSQPLYGGGPDSPCRRCAPHSKEACATIIDSVAEVSGELHDRRMALKEEAEMAHKECADMLEVLQGSGGILAHAAIVKGDMSTKLSESSSKLSMLTARRRDEDIQRKQLEKELVKETETCANEIHEAVFTRICGLQRARDHLNLLAGKEELPEDCEVSEWAEGECSQTCGGGTQTLRREVLIAANGGVQCPPLQMKRTCNEAKCPVDCKVGAWSAWSKCSAECDGGLQERVRNVLRKDEHGGDACPELVNTRVCNSETCNRDCVLHRWSGWSGCSRSCNGGTQTKTRGVKRGSRGSGSCPGRESPERLRTKPCNESPCKTGEVTCAGEPQDLVLVVDASGSLDKDGFAALKALAEELGAKYAPKKDGNHVSLATFSDQGKVLASLTADADELKTQMGELKWLKGATMLNAGLTAAKNALMDGGRRHAAPTVVVLFDGRVSDPFLSRVAVTRLREQGARLVFVTLGHGYKNEELLERLATPPAAQNLISVESASYLKENVKNVAREIILGTCSAVN